MTVHEIPPERRTLHGHFSRDLAPILEIEPGDALRTSTLESGWAGFEGDRDPALDKGHALIGPVAVRGAQPGDALTVRIVRLEPGPTAWNGAGGFSSPVNDSLGISEGDLERVTWELDRAAGLARSEHGWTVPLAPFLGVIGVAPAEPGVHTTTPPRRVGGNIDCRELVTGSTLVLPVEVPGALLSFGDGHAAQGDGEASTLALEAAMDVVELEIGLLPGVAPPWPYAETPAGRVTFGFSPDLGQAMLLALEGMVEHLESSLGLDRRRALALASVAVDLRVTQVVNQVMGVHALLPAGRLGLPAA